MTSSKAQTQAYIDYQKSDVIPRAEGGQTCVSRCGRQSSRSVRVRTSRDQGLEHTPRHALRRMGDAGTPPNWPVSPMVTAQRTYAIRTRPDLSYVADPAARPKMAILTTVTVKADRLMDFETFIKGEWIAALKKGGGKYYGVNQVVYGGNTTEYMTLVGIDNFAELDKGHPVNRALGDDGLVKLMTKAGGFAQNIDRRVIRLDTDLSFEVRARRRQVRNQTRARERGRSRCSAWSRWARHHRIRAEVGRSEDRELERPTADGDRRGTGHCGRTRCQREQSAARRERASRSPADRKRHHDRAARTGTGRLARTSRRRRNQNKAHRSRDKEDAPEGAWTPRAAAALAPQRHSAARARHIISTDQVSGQAPRSKRRSPHASKNSLSRHRPPTCQRSTDGQVTTRPDASAR